HLARRDQAQRGLLVHLRPLAFRPARREALHVALAVDRAHEAVDPPERERHLDRFRPSDRRAARALLPVDEPRLRLRLVVRIEPATLLRGVPCYDLRHTTSTRRDPRTKKPRGR